MSADKIVALFLGPLETCSWAKEAIKEFQVIAHRFIRDGATTKLIEHDVETGEDVHKVKLVKTIPSSIARKATEAIGHIRHSFDQAMFAAVNVVGGATRESIYFPWAETPSDLEHRLRGQKSKPPKIPIDLWPVLRSLEPYRTGQTYAGGNDLVRELAQIANRKHTIRLGFTLNVVGAAYANINTVVTGNFVFDGAKWDPVKNELVIARIPHGTALHYNGEIALNISFDEPGVLSGKPVPASLGLFLTKAHRAIESLRRESTLLVGS